MAIDTDEALWFELERLQEVAPIQRPHTIVYINMWHIEEELVIRDIIRRAGIGSWEQITEALPGKQKSQIYSKLQRILGVQALAPYHGL